jgi:MFS family permease
MQMVLMGWLVYSLTDSPFWLGMVGFARAVPVFSITLWAGVLADRADRRRVMLVTNTAIASLACLLGILVATGLVNVQLVLLIALLTGAAWSIEIPSRQSLVPNLVPRRDMINAIGLQSAAFNGAGIVGPPLAALLIDQAGISGAHFVNALFSLAVVVSLLLMKPVPSSGATAGNALTKLLEGFAYVRTTPSIAALFFMIAVANLIGRPYIQLMPAFARDVLRAGASGLGVLMGAVACGGLIGAIAVANVGSFRRRGLILIGSGMLFCTFLAAFALSPWLLLSLGLSFGMGFTQNFFFATSNTIIQAGVPGELRGRLMSMYAFLMMGFMPLGSTLLGALSELFGVQTTVALGGLTCLLVIGAVALRVERVRALE